MKWADSKWKAVLIWFPLGNWEHGDKLQMWYEYDNETIGFRYTRALNKANSWCYTSPIKENLPKDNGKTVVIKLTDEQAFILMGSNSKEVRKVILSILLKNKTKIDRKRPRRYKRFYHLFDIDGIPVKAESYYPLETFLKKHKTFKKFDFKDSKFYCDELLPKEVKEGYVQGDDEDWLEMGLFSKHENLMREIRC